MRSDFSAGGHLKPDPFNRPASLIEEFGVEAAAEAAAFEAEHVDVIKELVERENIDCDYVVTRAVDVQFKESIRDKLKAGYDQLIDSGVATTKGVFFTAGEKAEAVSSQVYDSNSRFSKSLIAFRRERSQRLLHLHCWPYLALQIRLTSLDESHLARSQSPNTHSSHPCLVKSRPPRILDNHHCSRYHQSKDDCLRQQCVYISHPPRIQGFDSSRSWHLLSNHDSKISSSSSPKFLHSTFKWLGIRVPHS